MWLIDIAVPGDGRVSDEEQDNVEKYQDLENRSWSIRNSMQVRGGAGQAKQ